MIKQVLAIVTILVSTQLQAAESFLEESEVALLKPHPTVSGVMRYVSPGIELPRYNNILFGSVTMYFSASSKAKDIDADEAKAISDAMKQALVDAAKTVPDVKVVGTPGPATILINVAITEITMADKKRGLFGYTPVGLVMTTAGNVAGMRIQLKDARIEGEVVDSVTGEVLTLFQVSEISPQDEKDTLSWGDVTQLFSTLLGQTLAAEKG